MKKILFLLLLPLLVNSQTIIMNPECNAINVEVDSLTKNYLTSNAVVEPIGTYYDLVSVNIDTNSSFFTVNFIEESLEYMILNTHIDTVNGDITYYIQNFLSSNYGMVFVSGGVYIIIEQIPDYFTKLNGILCFEL